MLFYPPWSARRLLAGLVVEEAGALELREVGLGFAAVEVDRPLDGGADRELEALEHAVAELHRPHDGVGRAHGDDVGAQGAEVLVAADLDRLLGADLHAVVALPALVGFLVVGLHDVPVEHHEVVGADVLAGGLVLPLAPIALLRENVTRHQLSSLLTVPLAGLTWEPPFPVLGTPARSCPPALTSLSMARVRSMSLFSVSAPLPGAAARAAG